MALNHLQEYSLVKYQPEEVLLMNKTSRKLYRFYDGNLYRSIEKYCFHPLMQKPLKIQPGLLYPKQLTTMQQEIGKKRNLQTTWAQKRYEENQLVNTFLPILECLQFLHKENIVHGGLCLETIIVDQTEQIRLRDLSYDTLSKPSFYYKNLKPKNPQQDFLALGYLILQCTTFKEISEIRQLQIDNLLKMISPFYSKGFILTISILTDKKLERFYPLINGLLVNSIQIEKHEYSSEIKAMYARICRNQKERDRKLVFTSPPTTMTFSQQLQIEELVSKKIGTGTGRKAPRTVVVEDTENKKTLQEPRTTTRNPDKTKMGDRNNLLIKEMVSMNSNNRKIHDALKKLSNRKATQTTTDSMRKTIKDNKESKDSFKDFREHKEYKDELIRGELPKRLRTVSRKKNF